jgi:hypothetical protein
MIRRIMWLLVALVSFPTVNMAQTVTVSNVTVITKNETPFVQMGENQ